MRNGWAGKFWSADARAVASMLALACLLSGCAARARAKAQVAALEAWAAGPAHWILLPEERRELKEVRTAAQAARFRNRFWSRRDPQGRSDGPGSFKTHFEDGVRAADQLYGEPGEQGSLTDRGGVLIVLGPPTGLQRTIRQVLVWEPDRRPGERRKRRRVPAETWIYPVRDLSPRIRDHFSRQGRQQLELTFVFERSGVHLQEGEKLLREASRALAASGD